MPPTLRQDVVRVPLDDAEMAMCRLVGERRNQSHYGWVDGRVDQRRDSVTIHVEGAIGEYAFAKAYGLDWTGKLWTLDEWQQYRKSHTDVSGVEVKTRPEDWHGLMVPVDEQHMKDKPFVLALTHELPTVVLAGWCMGVAVMRACRWKGWLPRPAFIIEQHDLAPMATLRPRLIELNILH